MPNYNVEFYEKPSGEVPVRDFILGLNPKMQAKIFQEIDSLEFFGPLAREPISKPIGDGIFELRAQFSNNITRIFYFFYVGKTIILTNGFVKKTPKTPRSEIDKARRYRDDYIRRKERCQ